MDTVDIVSVVINAVIMGILVYVIQKVFEERAERRLETFKSKIESTLMEHETRFAKLHEMRAEAIAELYKRLVHTQRSLELTISLIGSDPSLRTPHDFKDAKSKAELFWQYFDEQRICLPATLEKPFEEFYSESMDIFVNIVGADITEVLASNNKSYQSDQQSSIIDSYTRIISRLSPIRNAIDQEFRRLLGS